MHRWVNSFLAPIVVLFFFAACVGEEPVPKPTCVPDRANWDEAVKDVVATNCGLCHGERPDFSAPYSLTDYDELIKGEDGQRPVDKIVSLLKSGAMPPAPVPKPKHADFDTLILWASCGLDHPDYQDGLQSTAPVFLPEGEVSEDAAIWEITAGGFSVKANYLDRYQCFMAEVPATETSLIRRIEMMIDDSRVLHHVVLYRDTDRNSPVPRETPIFSTDGRRAKMPFNSRRGA